MLITKGIFHAPTPVFFTPLKTSFSPCAGHCNTRHLQSNLQFVMNYPEILLSAFAFVASVAANVLVFILLAKSLLKLSLTFCIILLLNYLLWAIHGYMANDIALICGSCFGILTSLCILGALVYNKITGNNHT
jgi:uncharacterized protein with PQ loop repeat